MRYKYIVIATFIAVALGLPLAFNVLKPDYGDWLGFWGSYLGGIITLAGVWLAFYLNRKQDIENRLLDKKEASVEAKLWCGAVMKRDYKKLSATDVVTMQDGYDSFSVNISVVSSEFGSIIYSIGLSLAILYDLVQSGEESKIKEEFLKLQQTAEKLHNLITETEGSSHIYKALKKKRNKQAPD